MSSPWFFKLEDRLRHSDAVRSILAKTGRSRARFAPRGTPQEKARVLARLCAAARLIADGAELREIEGQILELSATIGTSPLDWGEFDARITNPHISKGVILKPWISEREKGVLFISFEYHWAKLVNCRNLAELAKCYTLVASPSWCPPHSLINCHFPAIFPDQIFCLISNQEDLTFFPRFSPKYHMVPLLASNWVNADLFRPVPFEQKDVDLVMLANFGKYKRHHALFEALREMPKHLKVMLIGQSNRERTAEVLLKEALAFGVRDRLELKVNPSDEFVCDALARSKASLILSRREGSCVAVVESMFANTPVGVLRKAEIGSKKYVNEHTGRLLEDENLGAQLVEFIAQAKQQQPREWVMGQEIDCLGSTRVLNAALKKQMLADGQEWTQDIAAHHWRPDPVLLHAEDRVRMEPAYAEFKERFGLLIGPEK